ncbi:flagellar biosynthesis protein FlhA [Legionella israelensis]|uniref:flagellar biosynthesis protein FlhA n=1 Tax=Legionella israelensis TaxID=454 RepID=UPI001FD602FD|nr:flagellar biosynthesis protein FlhA [Legionella israelensis]
MKNFNFGSLILIVAMLTMVIIPLPPFLLDMLFSFNITLSLIILTVCLYIVRPLEFNIFPTILLVTTLLRLTLNIASTRIVLLHGHEGTDAAGQIIRAFGEVVIGGNFVVGLIIFIILMIINFVVVTKGAGRISEVSARFTLDALPGKQMSIDADVNAGIIDQTEAKNRRAEIIMESDFYGAMDGASKFVRGDAIAGLLILAINLIGGIIIGTMQYNMSLSNAAHTFSILTIGDGLVAQIPSLLLSISAAIMVTRVSNESDINQQTSLQLFGNSKPIFLAAMILTTIALIPKMPHFPLLSFAGVGFLMSYLLDIKEKKSANKSSVVAKSEDKTDNEKESELQWDEVSNIDRIALELGYGLIQLVGVKKNGQLVSRIKGVRKKISQKLGFLIPSIHIKDNVTLQANAYRIYLKGVLIAESSVFPNKLLAVSAQDITEAIPGIPAKDPTFGLDCYWINDNQKESAERLGFTVVDCSTVIATHLNQIIINHAGNILGYEEVQQLIDRLHQSAPKLAETLISTQHGLPVTAIFCVLQKLLHSGIPIIDFMTIAENMIHTWSKVKDIEVVTNTVRVALKQLIVYNLSGHLNELPVAVMNNELTQMLMKSIQLNQSLNEKMIVLEPGLTDKIYHRLLEYVKKCDSEGLPGIVLVHDDLRTVLERLFKTSIPNLHFLAFAEVPEDKQIKVVDNIG